MKEIIAYCGLRCDTCPIYLATRESDQVKKEEMIHQIIELCKEHYGVEYNVSDITECDGCLPESKKLFSGCAHCAIRKCAVEKAIENCAYCDEFVCSNLKSFFKTDSEAKKRLDNIRSRF